MAGSMQLKINVLTFFTYQSLKVNTELLIRTNHKSRLKGCLQKDQCYSNGQQTSNQLRFLLYHEALLFRYPTAVFHTQRPHKTSFTLALMLWDTSSTSVRNYWRYASDLTNHSHRIPKPWCCFVFVCLVFPHKTLRKGVPEASAAETAHNVCQEQGAQAGLAKALRLWHLWSQGRSHSRPPRTSWTGAQASQHIPPTDAPKPGTLPSPSLSKGNNMNGRR